MWESRNYVLTSPSLLFLLGTFWVRKCLKWLAIARSNSRVQGVSQKGETGSPQDEALPDHDATSGQSNEAVSPGNEKGSSSGEAVSCILRLPPELVVPIAERLLDKGISGVEHYSHLINITHVNSRLRSICIHTPSLWRKVFVEDSDGSLDLATTCVARSGNTGLDITTHVINRARERNEDILRLLHSTSHRITSLSIILTVTGCLDLLPKLQCMHMPRLHTLSADLRAARIIESVGTQPIFLFPKSPNLSSLSLASLSPETGTGRLAGIRRLCLTISIFWARPYTTLLNTLMSCQHLAELELSGGEAIRYATSRPTDIGQLPPVLPIHFSELLRLSIFGVQDHLLLYLLRNIDAPQLEFVELSNPHTLSGFQSDWEGIAYAEEDRLAFPSVRTVKVVPGTDQSQLSNRLSEPSFGIFLSKAFPNVEEAEIVTMSIIFFACETKGDPRRHPFWSSLSRLSVLKTHPQASFWNCSETLGLIRSFLQERESQGLSRPSSLDIEMCLEDLEEGELERWLARIEEVAGLRFVESQPETGTGGHVIILRIPPISN